MCLRHDSMPQVHFPGSQSRVRLPPSLTVGASAGTERKGVAAAARQPARDSDGVEAEASRGEWRRKRSHSHSCAPNLPPQRTGLVTDSDWLLGDDWLLDAQPAELRPAPAASRSAKADAAGDSASGAGRPPTAGHPVFSRAASVQGVGPTAEGVGALIERRCCSGCLLDKIRLPLDILAVDARNVCMLTGT